MSDLPIASAGATSNSTASGAVLACPVSPGYKDDRRRFVRADCCDIGSGPRPGEVITG